MFKKSLLALSLITLSGTALSAPPVANLKVTGSIAPPTCTINGLAEDTITYNFDISTSLFPASGADLVVDSQSKNIEVVCDATTYMSFIPTDPSGVGMYGDVYGLGTYGSNNAPIGYFTVDMKNATVKTSADATATSVGISGPEGYANTNKLVKDKPVHWATSGTQMAEGQIFAADFVVEPTILAAVKNNPDGVSLDGLAVLTFAFGV